MAASGFQFTILERIIKRFASEFVQDIDLHVNAQLGELELKNVRLKPGSFHHAERLLEKLGVDVWNTWDKPGTPTIFPHAVEIQSGTIERIKVKLPMPNPFNGEKWTITVDGTEGFLSTLPQSRRQQLLAASRARALQAAERHYSVFRHDQHKDQEAELRRKSARSSIKACSKSTDRSDNSKDSLRDDGDEDAQSDNSEEMSEGSYMERLQRRIDKYFKKHLAVTIINSQIRLNISEDAEFADCHWDITVNELSLDLGVGEIHLPENLQNHIHSAHCAFGNDVPEDRKPIAEMVGMTWKGIQLAIRGSELAPPVFSLDFPGRAFELHIVKKQWEESRRKHTNGQDRIKVTLPDDFKVGLHWDPDVLRAGLLRMLHQIFEGVTVAVPDFTDWLHTPWPGGWDCRGSYVQRAAEPRAARCTWMEAPLAHQLTEDILSTLPVGREWTSSVASTDKLGEEYKHLVSKVNPPLGTLASSLASCGDENAVDGSLSELSTDSLSSPCSPENASETPWWSYMWFRQRLCHGCVAPLSASNGEVKLLTHSEQRRLQELENTISVDWLAYWRTCWRLWARASGVTLQKVPTPPDDHGPLEPSPRWYVAPWRRHEVTLIGHARIDVSLTYGKARTQVMHVGIHRGLKAVMVRDQPADWFIWGSLPMLRLITAGEEWVTLPHTVVSVKWCPTKILAEEYRQIASQAPSLCRFKVAVATPTIRLVPGVIAQLAPLLCELPCVPSWPELRYFWGEWGYMQRPMAYKADSVSVNGAHVSVLTSSTIAPTSPEAGLKQRHLDARGIVDDQETGSFEMTLGPVDISTGVVHIDHSWQLLGDFQVVVREVRTFGVREKTTSSFVYLPTLYLRVQRRSGTPGVELMVDVRQLDLLVSVVPFLLTLFTLETFYAVFQARASHTWMAVAQFRALYHNIISFKWLWPLTVKVCSAKQFPVKIQIADRVQSLLKVEASFEMNVSMCLETSPAAERTPFLKLAMDPCVVELWYFNMSHVHDWEPLLERWSMTIGLEAGVPPQAYADLSIEGSHSHTLNLNVTPGLLRVCRHLAVSWAPVLVPLMACRVEELKMVDTHIPMSVLNLTGIAVCLKVKSLPQTETEVAIKVQSILRGRAIRRHVKRGSSMPLRSAASRNSYANSVSELSSVAFGNVPGPAVARAGAYRILAPGVMDPCAVTEAQRLIITMVQVQRFPDQLPPSTAEVAKRPTLNATSSPHGRPSFACCGWSPRRGTRSTGAGSERKTAFTGPQHLPKVTSGKVANNREDTRFDVTVLMDLTRHGMKAVWDTKGPDLPVYIMETISPTQGTRLLVIDSPLRLFNYTDRALEFCFLCGRNGTDTVIQASDSLVRGSTFKASALGSHQPIESAVYANKHGDNFRMMVTAAPSMAASTNTGCWIVPPGCYVSVPPSLRTDEGGVFFSMRCQGTSEWGSVMGVSSPSEDLELFTYRWPRQMEACRVLPCQHVMHETSTVKDAGRLVHRLDFVVMPLFSVANACPLPVQAKLQTPTMVEVLEIGEASVVHFYKLTKGDAGALTDMSMSLRFAKPGFLWSKPLHKFYSPQPRKHGTSPQDMTVKINGGQEVAETELVVRCGDICVVSCPVWLVDKSSLNLLCTDYLQRCFPVVGSHFLLDSTIGDNYLAIDKHTAASLSTTHLVRTSSSESVQEEAPKESVLETAMDRPPQSTNTDLAMAVLPKSVTRHTATMQLVGSGRDWPALKAFPLGIRWEAMKPPFGSFLSPPSYLITVQPQIVCSTDTRVQLRELRHVGSEVVVYPNASVPLWFAQGKGHRMLAVKFDGSRRSSAYSAGILLESGSVGRHSIAIHSKDDDTALVFGVMITDEIPGTLLVSFSTKPALLFRNFSDDVAEASLLTDHPQPGGKVKSASNGVNWSPQSSAAMSKLEVPACAFHCGPGKSVGAGWYHPFDKRASMDEVSLFLRWKHGIGESIAPRLVFLRIGLYSWKELVLLRPLHHVVNTKQEDRFVTGIRLIQEAEQFIVEVFSRSHIEQGNEDSIEVACGSCGERIHSRLPENSTSMQCTNAWCKEQLYIPLRVMPICNDAVVAGEVTGKRSSSGVLAVGSWLKCARVKGTLQIPNISISVCSQRELRPRELVHVSVQGVRINLAGQMLATRAISMDVQCVRVDRQFLSKRSTSTAVVVSTVVEDEPQTDAAMLPLAFRFNLLRVFVTSPTLCLKTLEVNMKQTFEVDIDTDFVNAMFQFGYECLHAIEMEGANSLSEFLEDMKTPATPQEVLAQATSQAKQPPSYKLHGYPMAVQTHTFKIGQINAKIWASLVLFDMDFVPATVARLMTFLTLSSSVNLTAANVMLEEHDFGMQRTSLMGLAHFTMRTYLPEVIRIGATVLGSTNLSKMVVAPVKAFAWTVSGAMSLFSSNPSIQHERDAESAPATQHKTAERKLSWVKASKNSKEPAGSDLPPVRLPRLLLAKGRLVPYNPIHARLLLAFGTRLDRVDMSQVLCIAELSQNPFRVVVVCKDELAVCELAGALLQSDSVAWAACSKGSISSETTIRHDSAAARQYPEGVLWGPWCWDAMASVGLVHADDKGTIFRTSSRDARCAPMEARFLEVVLSGARPEQLTWKADQLKDVDMRRINSLLKCLFMGRSMSGQVFH